MHAWPPDLQFQSTPLVRKGERQPGAGNGRIVGTGFNPRPSEKEATLPSVKARDASGFQSTPPPREGRQMPRALGHPGRCVSIHALRKGERTRCCRIATERRTRFNPRPSERAERPRFGPSRHRGFNPRPSEKGDNQRMFGSPGRWFQPRAPSPEATAQRQHLPVV